MDFKCEECGKQYEKKRQLEHYTASSHKGSRLRCPQCLTNFTVKCNAVRHFHAKHQTLMCIHCESNFMDEKAIFNKDHCDNCLTIKPQIGSGMELDNVEPIGYSQELKDQLDLEDYPADVQEEIQNYWHLIQTKKSINNMLDHTFNYRWTQFAGNFEVMLYDLYQNEKESFRINGSLGCFLKNKETGEVKYWYACHNNFTLLEHPILIKNGQDLKQLIETLKNIDLEEKYSRPSTKWALYLISNVEFYVIPQKDFIVGCKNFLLPDLVTHQHHNILGMTQDRQHNKFQDNLCLFRCVAQCITGNFEDKNLICNLFIKYCKTKHINADMNNFHGVPYTDLECIEKLFSIDIQVLHMDNDKQTAMCWKSVVPRYEKLLNLDISFTPGGQAHYSYIVNLDQYAKRYSCLSCSRLFRNKEKLNLHIKKHCKEGKTVHRFPGGVYNVKQSIFEQLEELDIHVDNVDRYCPYFAVYDFEALLIKKQQKTSEKLIFVAQHQPVSCAIATNVPGFEPICFVEEDPDTLIRNMLDHLELISLSQSELLMDKFQNVFEQLDALIEMCKMYTTELDALRKDSRREKGHLNEIMNTKAQLERYCSQLTCLGFNSGKYDINLIKRNIFPKLIDKVKEDEDCTWPKAILRNGSYLSLSMDNLKFLDISLYVAPGFSLDSFMKAYGATLCKAKFPYEYLDSIKKLNDEKLPPPEAFYSNLRKEAISDEDYQQCIQYWNQNRMKNLKDFLIFYNLRDVIPFLEATTKMAQLYWEQFGIDIFREAMSLPGVTERYLFKSIPDTKFALFSPKTKNLYYDLKASMRGGLSMVMTQLAIKDETFIRNNPKKPVKSIIGLDFNALYLWAQSMPTPIGFFDHWVLKDDKFRKIISSKTLAIEWLEKESWECSHFIQHLGNGKEKRIGPKHLPVDGYCKQTNTVYEFYSCYWHCHHCPYSKSNEQKDSQEEHKNRLDKESYIKSLGFNLITIWECQWKAAQKDYIKRRTAASPNFFRKYQYQKTVDKNCMETSIIDGSVFGFAKVDIYTPQHLKAQYADFPPIIKHAEVGRDDAGDLMKAYAEKTAQLKQPRNNLISSYFGKNIYLSTPMIQFLIKHGLVLEKIHEIVQYDKGTPFESFKDKVTKHRQEGDVNPELSMIADTFKLLGNTGYGKTLTNKEKHEDVSYADFKRAAELSRSPYIKKVKSITENCYEVHMKKKEISLDLPITIGLSVYNWAKVRMLEFFYDVLQKYFNTSDYQCMETDTDSIYLALASENLLDIVKPELRDEFMRRVYPKWFVVSPEDKRTPGLLKEEWRGTAMCCLSAKTYMGIGEKGKKVSCKGLMKKTNDLTFEKYTSVLKTETAWNGENVGFRMLGDNQIWTYVQQKQGLPFLYIKRKVLDDGITTIPLDL